jgi:hypothetical protein
MVDINSSIQHDRPVMMFQRTQLSVSFGIGVVLPVDLVLVLLGGRTGG